MFYDFIKGYKSPVEKKHRHFFDDSFYNHDDCVNTSILDFLRNALIPETLRQDNTRAPLLQDFVRFQNLYKGHSSSVEHFCIEDIATNTSSIF